MNNTKLEMLETELAERAELTEQAKFSPSTYEAYLDTYAQLAEALRRECCCSACKKRKKLH